MSNKYEWLTKEILQKDYEELGNFKFIAEKYSIPRSTVERYCKVLGVKTTPKVRYTCDDTFFSKDTEESFYVAGFIAADGCVNQHKSDEPNYLSICISKKDEGHLLKIVQLLKFDGPIKYQTKKLSNINENWNDVEQCRVDIYSKHIINDLKRFNIGPRKSLTYEFPKWLADHALVFHFMRGYFDGDGSFHISKERKVTKKFGIKEYSKFVFSLRGTTFFLGDFGILLSKHANIQSAAQPKFNNGIDMLRYSGNKQVSKIANYLYNNAHIYLERKFDIVKELL